MSSQDGEAPAELPRLVRLVAGDHPIDDRNQANEEGFEESPPVRVRDNVGYGKPPKEHQFRKGKSGNPYGRPPKLHSLPIMARNQSSHLVIAEAKRPVTINAAGVPQNFTTEQALVRTLTYSGLKGDSRDLHKALSKIEASHKQFRREWQSLLKTASEYRLFMRLFVDWFDNRKRVKPHITPHPYDIVINLRTEELFINGPLDEDDQRLWDELGSMQISGRDIIGELDAQRKGVPQNSSSYNELCKLIDAEENRLSIIASFLPDKNVRRTGAFEMRRWRAEQPRNREIERRLNVLMRDERRYGSGQTRAAKRYNKRKIASQADPGVVVPGNLAYPAAHAIALQREDRVWGLIHGISMRSVDTLSPTLFGESGSGHQALEARLKSVMRHAVALDKRHHIIASIKSDLEDMTDEEIKAEIAWLQKERADFKKPDYNKQDGDS